MKKTFFPFFPAVLSLLFIYPALIHSQDTSKEFDKDYITAIMYRVNQHQKENAGGSENRNWKRGTWFTGIMAFYQATGDTDLLNQAINWAEENEWRIGNELIYPANRLTCAQTYFEIFYVKHDSSMIRKAGVYMDSQLLRTEPAYLSGWDYIDALYVGAPAYAMLGKITGEKKYIDFMNRIFTETKEQLYDKSESLFYRDNEARFIEKSKNGKKVLWSRGNGWAIASLPRILRHLPKSNSYYNHYAELLKEMAASLAKRQGSDGLWRSNLADQDEYPMPESSGTAFFTYAMAWGINNGLLDPGIYIPVVHKAWKGLCNVVNEQGKVCWGQLVARGPGKVAEEDSDEYVTGAFLLAGSEMLKLAEQ
jgi:rhamnogalacturonyl hydrolase YesR